MCKILQVIYLLDVKVSSKILGAFQTLALVIFALICRFDRTKVRPCHDTDTTSKT